MAARDAVSLLLDTCAILRLGGDLGGIPLATQSRIRAADGPLLVSAISAWEIAMLVAHGRLQLPMADPAAWYQATLAGRGLTEVPITGAIAAAAVALPGIHQDPADRFIIATARQLRAEIVTKDQIIPLYPGAQAIWG